MYIILAFYSSRLCNFR